jgi:rSAM/selenodomain-associated transferase 2
MALTPKISCIIPVLHEGDRINQTISHVRSLAMASLVEIIVADGDPDKSTLQKIADPNVAKVAALAGRGVQMNAGAKAATGDILLFLHADTSLPKNAVRSILDVCQDETVMGGAFDVSINAAHPGYRMIEKCASLRSRITRIPFGDQAIFIKAEYFRKLKGFKDIPLMEDIDIMLRMKQSGFRIRLISDPVKTSARRWEKEGMIYTTLRNWMIRFLFYTGVSPEKLKKYYRFRGCP